MCQVCGKKIFGWDLLIADGKSFHRGCYYNLVDKNK